ncbi:MAG: hypothetical protein NC321_15930 [Clostridium sp.]|nr:hypothetical protein [Clostridium sp.]
MSITGITNNSSAYANYINSTIKSRTNQSSSFIATADNRTKTRSESVVREYVTKHPESKSNVDKQLRLGREVLKRNNAENVSRADMTMAEYKQFFTALMDSIPFDSSQKNNIEVWNISEKGWEQMKTDPDYEAWILGYTAQDRAVHNPFAAMPGYSPNYHTEHFGASIEEHIGQSVPMSSPAKKDDSDSDEESWWLKRHKRIKEILAENAEIARENAMPVSALLLSHPARQIPHL